MNVTKITFRGKRTLIGFFAAALVLVGAPAAYAANTADSQLTQEISNGVLSTDIRNASNGVVANPSFGMSSVDVSTSEQTSTGTFGDNSQRISVDNPGGAPDGWTLALNATTPGTGEWSDGSNSYSYNGATSGDGQLTVDPSVGSITPVTGTSTGVTLGTSATFTGTTPITLMAAANTSDDIWNGYLTGVSLSQTIPASQPSGSYTIDMTQTVTAS